MAPSVLHPPQTRCAPRNHALLLRTEPRGWTLLPQATQTTPTPLHLSSNNSGLPPALLPRLHRSPPPPAQPPRPPRRFARPTRTSRAVATVSARLSLQRVGGGDLGEVGEEEEKGELAETLLLPKRRRLLRALLLGWTRFVRCC